MSGGIAVYERRVLGRQLEVAAYLGRDRMWRVSRIIIKHSSHDLELLPLERDDAGKACVRLDGRLFRIAGLFKELRRLVP